MKVFMYTVTDHPSDYPDKYVIRTFEIEAGKITATEQVELFDSLEEIERKMSARGLMFLPRMMDDDPVIVGVWL